MNEGTNGRTNRQLARGPSESRAERGRDRGECETWKGPGLVQLRGPATPALSPIIRVRFEARFSGPLRGQNPRESHREASRPKRLHRPLRYGARKEGMEEEEMQRETGALAIHYVASAVRHGSISPFWRGVWSAHLFLRPQKPRDRNGRMLCGDHRGEWLDHRQDSTIVWFSSIWINILNLRSFLTENVS